MWAEFFGITGGIVGGGLFFKGFYELGRFSERKRLEQSLSLAQKHKEAFKPEEYEKMLKEHLDLLEKLK